VPGAYGYRSQRVFSQKNEQTIIPLLTYNFLEYFVNNNLKDKTLLELGSGDSTLFWENYFKKITSYEDDVNYYTEYKHKINKEKTDLIFYDKELFNSLDFLKNFLKNVKEADCIIIDNNPCSTFSRYDFANFVTNNKKENSVIILDNGTWNLDAYNYLINHFFCNDFPGINKNNELTVTTIFHTRKINSYYCY
jgi:hypothetical protein